MLIGVTVGSILNYIGGRFVEGEAGFDDVNPVDGSVVARVHEADAGWLTWPCAPEPRTAAASSAG
jgi:hypothetical protein